MEHNFSQRDAETGEHVLGKSLMDEVRKDITASVFPLGVSKAPLNWGTPSRGKLKADEWRVLNTIHLPITLIRLWGYPPEPGAERRQGEQASTSGRIFVVSTTRKEDSQAALQTARRTYRLRLMLRNYLDLTNTILLSNNKISSAAHADSYRLHVTRYLRTAQSLYRHFKVKPIHHIAGHFDHFLRDLGPSHAFRTAGFERMNHTMQTTNTNNHLGMGVLCYCVWWSSLYTLGEMERTFLKCHGERSALAWILQSDEQIAKNAQAVVHEYTKIREEQNLGLRMMKDDVHQTEGVGGRTYTWAMDDWLIQLLATLEPQAQPPQTLVQCFPKVVVEGTEYAGAEERLKGSFALISHGPTTSPRAGQINRIIRTSSGNIFLLCSLFRIPEDRPLDLYQAYGQGFLVGSAYEPTKFLARTDRLRGPCIVTPVIINGHERIHVLPRCRVISY